jgi:multicomponent K+:H+ antiporter subunit G
VTWATLFDAAIAALLLIGAFFTFTGSLALLRFDDFFLRVHGPTKATTLGVGGLLAAAAAYFSWREGSFQGAELLLLVFLFLTAPVSAHLMTKAALHLKVRARSPLPEKRQGAAGWRHVPSSADARDDRDG